ncbi:MAG: 2-oxoacid:acceptor oxidoreductase family protein [Archaeoglobaceae archaeon]
MLIETIIYSRGGQGGVTTAKIIATSAMLQGLFSQAIPQFGPERRGATVKTYLRISDKPIRRRSSVKDPDVVVVFDKKIEVEKLARVAVLNSKESIQIAEKTFYVDASSIAEKFGLVNAGWAILSAPMSGAIAKALEIDIRTLEEAIKMELGEKAEKSCSAAKEAYEVTKWISSP